MIEQFTRKLIFQFTSPKGIGAMMSSLWIKLKSFFSKCRFANLLAAFQSKIVLLASNLCL
uniref:Uncharacterized protein n=1 Tax=Arundo donax TaxID=35708 RepID=A0A0A8Y4V9_ARUDO